MTQLSLINFVLRRTLRPVWARSLSVSRMRRAFRISAWLGTCTRRTPPFERDNIGGVAAEWIGNRHAAAQGVLVWVHGGSFVIHVARSERLLCADLARRTGLPVMLADYRLAPESPFPAGLDDCVALYDGLLARGIPAGRMVIAGHSAGGNLVAAMLMRVRDAGLPQPAGAVLLSGCFDLTGPTPAALAMAERDVCATPDIWTWTCRHYLDGHDAREPLVSPFFGDWRGLAPLQFQVSDSENLYDSVMATAERARRAGVDVTVKVWKDLPHFYPAMDMLEEGRRCRIELAEFATRVLSRDVAVPAQTTPAE